MSAQETEMKQGTLRGEFSASDQQNLPALARKTKPPRRQSGSPITLRVTDEERATLKKQSAGQPVSAYIRQCVFGTQQAQRPRARYRPTVDQSALAQVLALLGQSRIANNLNQLAHNANRGSLIMDDDALAQIEEAYRHVKTMRATLIKAVGLIESA